MWDPQAYAQPGTFTKDAARGPQDYFCPLLGALELFLSSRIILEHPRPPGLLSQGCWAAHPPGTGECPHPTNQQ